MWGELSGRVPLTLWTLIQFQLTVPISVVFAKGTLVGGQERKLPFKENQETETPLNRKFGGGGGTALCFLAMCTSLGYHFA